MASRAFRRVAGSIVVVLLLALVGAAGGSATDGFTSPTAAVTVAAGGSAPAPESVHLDAAPQKANIVLAFDTTGSMGPVLTQAQADAQAIVSDVQASIPGTHFAVIDFRDYYPTYSPTSTDYPYQFDSGFASSSPAFPTSTGDGGDLPEAYNRALWEVWDDSNLNSANGAPHLVWEGGAARFVIVLGDQVGHDANFSSFDPSCTSTASTDPGPSGTGLPTRSVLDLLKANNISVSFVSYAAETAAATNRTDGTAIQNCQQAMATYTGGSLVVGNSSASSGTLASQITTLVGKAAAHISALRTNATNATAGDAANPASWVTFSGLPSSTDVSLSTGSDYPFTATVSPPAGTPAGTYNVNLNVLANGVTRTTQPLAITVKKPLANLTVSASPDSVGAGIGVMPLSSLTPAWISYYAGSTTSSPVGSTPVGSTPVGSTPVGSTPVGSTPVGSTPVGSTPVGSTPVGSTPVGSTGLFDLPVGSTPVGSTPLSNILLSQINLIGTSWDQVLCPGLAAKPVNTLTVDDLKASTETCGTPAQTSFQRFEALTLKQVDLSTTLLRSIHWASLLMGNTPLSSLPDGYAGFCAAIGTYGGSCANTSPATTVLGLDMAGQLGSAPVGSTPVGSTPVGSTPVGSTPVGSTDISASRLSLIPLSSISPATDVVDCTKVNCSTQTLGDAARAGAILPNVTFANAALLAAMNASGITINDIIVAVLGATPGLFPWEQLPVQGLQAIAPGAPTVTYTEGVSVDCSVASSYSLAARLPDGFFADPPTAKISINGGAPTSAPVPTIAPTTNTFTWPLVCADADKGTTENVVLTFTSYVGLTLGGTTATATAAAASFSLSTSGAPVNVHETGEPVNNDPSTAPEIQADQLVVGHLGVSGDQDFYRFKLDGLTRGTKVFVYLKVPSGSDFDLTVSKPAAPSFFSTPVGSTPVGSTPIEDRGIGFSTTGASLPSETLQDVPVGSTPVGSTPVGSTPVGSTSTTRGDANETAEIIVNGEAGYATIDVTGYNGASSNSPYVLRVQTVAPPPLPTNCPARTLSLGTAGALPSSLGTSTKTLFIVDKQRLTALYNATDVSNLLTALSTLAQRSEVSGAVLQVDGSAAVRNAYAAWDQSPCDPGLANGVVRSINDVVASYRNAGSGLPNLHYIVLVGGDEATPMARTPDPVTLSPEENEASDLAFTTAGLANGNALYDSEAQNYLLTDGAYGALNSIQWLGRDLLLPQLAVARLVETPADILGQVNRYLKSSGYTGTPQSGVGLLNPTSELVTGYDFLADGSQAVHDNLVANFPGISTALDTFPSGNPAINVPSAANPFSANDVIANFLASTGTPASIASLNAHYNHWEFEAANGDLGNTGQAAAALAARILFTMGCHGGLNVADSLGGPGAKYLDWPQLYGRDQAAVYIANTGFGYGDSSSVALSERLLALFAKNLHSDSNSVGEEWAAALQQYFATAGAYDVYDEKVMEETTFYGLPFWHFGTPAPSTTAFTPLTTTTDPATGTQSATITFGATDGFGQTQFGLYRPLLPIRSKEVTSASLPARGLWIQSLQTQDTPGGATPGYPTIDLASHEPKPRIGAIFFPASPFSLERSMLFGKEHDWANISDQYRPITGQQRHVTGATLEIFYSNTADVVPPLISQVGVTYAAPNATIQARVTDDSGVVKEVAALVNDGAWTYVQLAQLPQDPTIWTATVPVNADPEVFIEATDGQNVGYSANKGSNFTSTNSVSPSAAQIYVQAPVGPYGLNQQVNATYQCVAGAVAVAQCVGSKASGESIDTTTFGQHTFTVRAFDASGNVIGSLQRTYVVAYPFKGFFAPVDNQPVLNLAKAGSAIPVKFSLTGYQGLDVFFDTTYPRPVTISCDSSAPVDVVTTVTAGSSSLSYDSTTDQYTYTWKTDPSWAGSCRALIVKLKDGTTHRADFQFK